MTGNEAVVASERAIARMTLVNANRAARVDGLDEQRGKVNYFVGDPRTWRSNIPTFAKVRYRNVYHGIDLIYYGKDGELEYDLVVAPGADPTAIRLALDVASLKIDTNGDLVGQLADGDEIRMRRPVIYQDVDGTRVPVDGSWRLAKRERPASAWAATTARGR